MIKKPKILYLAIGTVCVLSLNFSINRADKLSMVRIPVNVESDSYLPIFSGHDGYVKELLVDDVSLINTNDILYEIALDKGGKSTPIRTKVNGIYFNSVRKGSVVSNGQIVGHVLPNVDRQTLYFHIEARSDLKIGAKVKVSDGRASLEGVIQTIFMSKAGENKIKLGIVLGESIIDPILSPNSSLELIFNK